MREQERSRFRPAQSPFSGPEIQTLDSALGTEVTVTLEDVADLHLITLTLLIPEMWIAPDAGMEVRTLAIYMTKEERFAAPSGCPPCASSTTSSGSTAKAGSDAVGAGPAQAGAGAVTTGRAP